MWTLIYYKFLKTFIYKKYNYQLRPKICIFILLFEILLLVNKDLLLFAISQILIFQSITDIINKDVYTLINLLFIPIAFYTNQSIIDNLLSEIIVVIIYLLSKIINGIGIGDINLLFYLGLIFDYPSMLHIILLASILNILYALFHPKKSYSFIPFISISCIVIYTIKP